MIRIWNNFSKKLHLISYHTPPSLSLSELTNNEAGLNLNLYPPIIMPTYGKAIKIQSQQSGNAFKESADYIHNWKFQQLQILLFSGCTGSLNQMSHDHCLKIKLRRFQINFIQSNWKANVSVRKLQCCVQNGTRPLSQKVTVFGDSAPRGGSSVKKGHTMWQLEDKEKKLDHISMLTPPGPNVPTMHLLGQPSRLMHMGISVRVQERTSNAHPLGGASNFDWCTRAGPLDLLETLEWRSTTALHGTITKHVTVTLWHLRTLRRHHRMTWSWVERFLLGMLNIQGAAHLSVEREEPGSQKSEDPKY